MDSNNFPGEITRLLKKGFQEKFRLGVFNNKGRGFFTRESSHTESYQFDVMPNALRRAAGHKSMIRFLPAGAKAQKLCPLQREQRY